MIIRAVTAADHPQWAAMRAKLWPDADPEELERELTTLFAQDPPYSVFIAETDNGGLAGFIELWVRSYAEGGPTEPSAYVEGLYVEPDHRRAGVARTLLAKAEEWARGLGLKWLGSDALLTNGESHGWHRAAGFAEVERLVVFGKSLA